MTNPAAAAVKLQQPNKRSPPLMSYGTTLKPPPRIRRWIGNQAKATTENPAAADRQAIACLFDQNYILDFDAATPQSDIKVA